MHTYILIYLVFFGLHKFLLQEQMNVHIATAIVVLWLQCNHYLVACVFVCIYTYIHVHEYVCVNEIILKFLVFWCLLYNFLVINLNINSIVLLLYPNDNTTVVKLFRSLVYNVSLISIRIIPLTFILSLTLSLSLSQSEYVIISFSFHLHVCKLDNQEVIHSYLHMHPPTHTFI